MKLSYQLSTFSNRLRYLAIPLPTQSVTVMVMIGAGSRYEKRGENGISHFLEHMAFKGTKKRLTAREIAEAIEGIGGEFNAYTSKDHTVYWVKAAKEHGELLVDILSDMVLHSRFVSEEIEREKGVIIEEINMYEDTPMRKIGTEFEMLLYGDTPLGWDIAGTKEIIRSINRENFLSYTNRLYKPSNAAVVVAGGADSLQEKTEAYFRLWKEGKTDSFKKLTVHQKKPAVKLVSKKTEQTHIVLGVHTFNRNDPRRYILSVLSIILGGGMSSRLFHEVRERRGLAYYIRSDINRYEDCGNIAFQAGVESGKMKEAVKVIRNELEKIASENITSSELKRAKEFVKGHLILSLEDSHEVAELYGASLLLEGRIRTPEEILKGITRVTADQVRTVAREIFSSGTYNLAVIGPFEQTLEYDLQKLLE